MNGRTALFKMMVYVFICFPAICYGQVSMTLQVPPGGVMLKSQLWNMALVYTGRSPLDVRISLTLSSAAGDHPLLTAASPFFLLQKGAKQIQAAEVSPIQYDYLSPVITDRNPDGFLPVGSYQACYTVQLADETNTPLAEECVSFEVEPLSTVELNSPANEDTIVTTAPQFTWLPPAPLNLFNSLSYKFTVVQVLAGQHPADALEQNLPVYVNQSWPDNYLNYPSSALSLDTGKQYAWQVVAQNNLQPSVQSEIWTFRIKGLSPAPSPFNGNYVLLKSNGEKSGVYMVQNGVVGIKYYSFEKEHTSTITFLSSDKKVTLTDILDIKYGDNYFSYSLNGNFQTNGLYFIQIADTHNNIYSAAFRIIPPKESK